MTNSSHSYRHVSFDSINSTNKYALSAALDGEPGNLWVTAKEQTEGRGRRGRAWDSREGNLFASLMLVDTAPMKALGQLPPRCRDRRASGDHGCGAAAAAWRCHHQMA